MTTEQGEDVESIYSDAQSEIKVAISKMERNNQQIRYLDLRATRHIMGEMHAVDVI